MKKIFLPFLAVLLTACQEAPPPTEEQVAEPAAAEPAVPAVSALDAVLAAQPADVQARYQYRHPKETLEFFGVEPGMTVVEALPGGGWYTKILATYLGADGKVIGADYSIDLYKNFGFYNDEFGEAKKTWVEDWSAGAADWGGENGATVSAFVFGSLPDEMAGTADVVLFVRAMHNLARFESQGGFLTQAIDDTWRVLRPGGIVGIVQHHARDDMPDDWASGAAGYLKTGFLIGQMEKRGFEFFGESDINANPNDQPTTDDAVWRLPPSLGTSQDNPELRASLISVGESNRMTLKFRKPE
jgi:predicted methyltransferase